MFSHFSSVCCSWQRFTYWTWTYIHYMHAQQQDIESKWLRVYCITVWNSVYFWFRFISVRKFAVWRIFRWKKKYILEKTASNRTPWAERKSAILLEYAWTVIIETYFLILTCNKSTDVDYIGVALIEPTKLRFYIIDECAVRAFRKIVKKYCRAKKSSSIEHYTCSSTANIMSL